MKYFHANNTKRYIGILPKLVVNYNNSFYNSLGMTPVQASLEENESKVYNNLYTENILRKPEFNIGDKIRITKFKTFMRGYEPTYTKELFKVSEVLKSDPIKYKIKDLKGDDIDGT